MEKLKFLGIGSAFNPLWGNNSAYYKNDKSLLLIDCGETNFERILKANLLEDVKNIFILITHLHPDHVGSLGSLLFYLNYIKKIKGKIIFYDKENLETLLKLMGVSKENYNLCHNLNKDELKELKISSIDVYPIKHSDKLKSYGYKITFDDKEVIFYTGDCKEIDNRIIKEVIEGKISKIYVDSFCDKINGVPHITVDELCDIFPEKCRQRVYGMHYDGEKVINKLKVNGFKTVKITN